jgi:GlcNAc-PI de-N-acetylase
MLMSHFGRVGFAVGLLLPLAAQAQDARPYEKTSFYFAAHEDDWQLFMNPSAFLDVTGTKTKTIFVHVTAGDAGSGLGRRGRKHPFYLARENGAEAAIRFMADANELPAEKVADRKTFNGHSIYRVSYRNTVSYFLRVPDGNASGAGYPETGNESLRLLAEGARRKLRAIDGSTTYRGWGDLTATLRALIDYERADAPVVQINVGETDPAINPGDHSDHLMTAKAAVEAAKSLTCARRLHFVDYASSRLPENLDAKQRDMESAVFAVTAAGIRALDHSSAWHHYNDSYVGRNYFRVEEGTGRCTAPGIEMATANSTKRN